MKNPGEQCFEKAQLCPKASEKVRKTAAESKERIMGILEAYEKDGTLVITPDKVYDTKIKHADTNVTVNGTVKGLLRTCRNSVTVNGTVNERYR